MAKAKRKTVTSRRVKRKAAGDLAARRARSVKGGSTIDREAEADRIRTDGMTALINGIVAGANNIAAAAARSATPTSTSPAKAVKQTS